MPDGKDAAIQQAIQILQSALQGGQEQPEQEGGGLREILQKKVDEGGGLE